MVTFDRSNIFKALKNGTFNEVSWVTHSEGDKNFGLCINKHGRLFTWDHDSYSHHTLDRIWTKDDFVSDKIRKVARLLPKGAIRFTLFLSTEKLDIHNLHKLCEAQS